MIPKEKRKPSYSPKEVAELAGVSSSTVLDWIHAGKLFAVRLSPRIYRIPIAAVVSVLYPDEVRVKIVRRTDVDVEGEIEEELRRLRAEHGWPEPRRITRKRKEAVGRR